MEVVRAKQKKQVVKSSSDRNGDQQEDGCDDRGRLAAADDDGNRGVGISHVQVQHPRGLLAIHPGAAVRPKWIPLSSCSYKMLQQPLFTAFEVPMIACVHAELLCFLYLWFNIM